MSSKKKSPKRSPKRSLDLKSVKLPGSISPGEPYDFFEDGISQSLISTSICRQRMVLSLNRWRVNSTTTVFGSCFHEMLDFIYSVFMETGKVPSSIIIKKKLRAYMKEEMKGKHGRQFLETMKRAVNLTEIILPVYLDYYAKDFKSTKWLEVERTFDTKFEGIRQRGKRDGVFLDKRKKRWLMEHKTKGRININDILLKLTFDFQCLYYITMFEREFKLPIEGVKYNIIRNPGNKLVGRADYKRLQKEIEKKPKYYFMRYENVYTKEDKKEFLKNLTIRIEELKDFFNGNAPVYKNQFACKAPYPCKYLDACSSNSLKGYKVDGRLFQELN